MQEAIKFKEIIEKIPTILNPIGNCPIEEYRLLLENIDEDVYNYAEDEDGDGDGDNNIFTKRKYKLAKSYINLQNKLINLISSKLFTDGHIDISKYKLDIIHKGFKYSGNMDFHSDLLKEIYKCSDIATYGNLDVMATEINKEVRSGKDLYADSFEVDPKLINKLRNVWVKNMYPLMKLDRDKIKIVPYKINLYSDGDHFKNHTDTPDTDLIGTILISLNSKRYKDLGGNLLLDDKKFTWDPYTIGNWCAFYTDINHEVEPVKGNWVRCTMAFKVFSSVNRVELLENTKLLKKKIKKLKTPYGFILGHKYSKDTETFKGGDLLLMNVLKKMNYKIERLPICIKYDGETDESGSYNKFNINVYPITNEYISFVENGGILPVFLNGKKIEFMMFDKGYKWYHYEKSYHEYTGNECQPGNINSLYLNHAVIFY
jgi:hypothetical protein